MAMQTMAVVIEQPERLRVQDVELVQPGADDVVIDVSWTGVSAGTERLLWTGRMPAFPGMGYPLVPGYESVGTVVEAGRTSGRAVGDHVFVAGARCYTEARALFGGAARRLVVPGARATTIDASLGERAVLLALAATARHALSGGPAPELIIGHGVLGRLVARLTTMLGAATPTVWETNPVRFGGAHGYRVCTPDDDPRRDYRTICDVSGSSSILDDAIARLAPRGEIILAGFYDTLAFRFPPAFQREARIRVAAEFTPVDLTAVSSLANRGALDLGGLVTHRAAALDAAAAYDTAFSDAACVKMVLDWRQCA
jgi:bacteriochlorophyllide a dehydrogenase